MSWLIFAFLLLANLIAWQILRRREQALFDEIRATAGAASLAEELLKTARASGHEALVFRRPEALASAEIEVLAKSGDSWRLWRSIPVDQALPLLDAFETLLTAYFYGVNRRGDAVPFHFTDFQGFDPEHLPLEIRLKAPATAGGTPAIQ